MLKKYNVSSRCILFIPGLIILVLGMVSLHVYMLLVTDHQSLHEYHMQIQKHVVMLGEASPLHDQVSQSFLELFERHQTWLYWSILGMGLTAFILLILNADKMIKLRDADAARLDDLQLLNSRLAAIEASGEGIGIVNKDGKLTYMNPALMRLHGIQDADRHMYIEESWFNLYTEEGQDELKKNVVPKFEKAGIWKGVSPIVRNNGEVIIAELTMTRLDDGGFIGMARDVTVREKEAEEKRTMQAQLYQAQKMEAIGRLAGGIAHDFNNILAAIRGYAEFLTEDLNDNPEQKVFAENILSGAKHAGELTEKILAFSRSGEASIAHIDIVQTLNESLPMIDTLLSKSLSLETNIDIEEIYVMGSNAQISQMIMNLCVNARDAMDKDEANVKVVLTAADVKNLPDSFKSENLPEPGDTPIMHVEEKTAEHSVLFLGMIARNQGYVCLRVEDNGCGMPKDVIAHIFEPFFTTKAVNEGTGLGLASLHGLLSDHRGALMVDSRVGEGTVFNIYLPVASEDEAAIPALEKKPVNAVMGTGTILLVEDQKDVRDMMSTMLKRLGYEYILAEDGADALGIVKEKADEIDLVLTDQNMPKMKGIEFIEAAHEAFPELPFVLMSGYSKERLSQMHKEYPAIKAVMRKPASKARLAETLASVLDGEDTGQAQSKSA